MSGASEKSRSTASKLAEKELEKLRRQDFWLRIQRTKLLLDLLFVCEYDYQMHSEMNLSFHIAYEIFNIRPMQKIVKPFAGLGAAVLRYEFTALGLCKADSDRISTARLFHNHRTTLILKETRN